MLFGVSLDCRLAGNKWLVYREDNAIGIVRGGWHGGWTSFGWRREEKAALMLLGWVTWNWFGHLEAVIFSGPLSADEQTAHTHTHTHTHTLKYIHRGWTSCLCSHFIYDIINTETIDKNNFAVRYRAGWVAFWIREVTRFIAVIV